VPELVGRDAELRSADRALDLAAEGRSRLLIRGDAGIGKSTLWDAVVARAVGRGWRVLSARAAAAEAPLMLATLGDLLETIDDAEIARLPDPQAAALRAALLRAEPDRGGLEPRALGAAVRAILEHASAERPVVIAIDDAQWIDPASAAALGYALHRLPAQRIATILAVRTGHAVPFQSGWEEPAAGSTDIDVGPLSLGGIHALLQARLGGPPRRSSLVRIHEASGGNPLFALEIARAIERAGPPLPGEPLPVPGDVEELVRGRIRALAPGAREVLLCAAAAGRPTVELVAAALGRSIADDVRVADDADVARDRDGVITFSHPLYAAAILALASPADRRATHGRLAAVVTTAAERGRHLALAAAGPDAVVAAAVVTTAARRPWVARRSAGLASARIAAA